MATKKENERDMRDMAQYLTGSLQQKADRILWLKEALRIAKREFTVSAGVFAEHEPNHKIILADIWDVAHSEFGLDHEAQRRAMAKYRASIAKKPTEKKPTAKPTKKLSEAKKLVFEDKLRHHRANS